MPSRGVCSQCRKEGEVFTCSACGDVHYCSRGCQKAGWVSGHKFDCGQSRAPQPTHAAAAAAAAAPSGAAAHRAPQSAAPLVTEGLKAALLESLERSPVTFVVGRTGSGKSTQIPQVIQTGLGGRVLVSSPRRLAAVAVATQVAAMRGVDLGSSVGYHVGSSRVCTEATELVFTTAGMLLEQFRSHGVDVFRRWSCIVLDEAHERSAESDLVLSLLRQALVSGGTARHGKKKQGKLAALVLMSATFDTARYQEYLAPLCATGPRLPTIALPVPEANHRVEVQYLEDLERAPPPSCPICFESMGPTRRLAYPYACGHGFCQECTSKNAEAQLAMGQPEACALCRQPPQDGPRPPGGAARAWADSRKAIATLQALFRSHLRENTFPPRSVPREAIAPLHRVLRSAVWDAVAEHPVIVVFLPSYRMVEEQVELLEEPGGPPMWIQVLHSSVDLDSCMAAIMATPTGVSTVVLSTNVGESSITVPRATLVLDLCLHLEVTWDHRTDGTTPRMVWCSQSQAEQRKGRVGRCQDGRAIRLLPSAAYHKLRQHEASAIEIGSLRNVALALFTTARPCRPLQVLDGCLTPPARERVDAALEYLAEIGAVRQERHQQTLRWAATPFGRLLAAFPCSVSEARIVAAGYELQRSVVALPTVEERIRIGLPLAGELTGTAGLVGVLRVMRSLVLRDAILLAALRTESMHPIAVQLTQRAKYVECLKAYRGESCGFHDKHSVLLANLAAMRHWMRCRLGPRIARGHQELFRHPPGADRRTAAAVLFPPDEGEDPWYRHYGLSFAACVAVLTTADDIWTALRRMSPLDDPVLYPPLVFSDQAMSFQRLAPSLHEFYTSSTVAVLQALLRHDLAVSANSEPPDGGGGGGAAAAAGRTEHDPRPPCRFFLQGTCTKGGRCGFSHSMSGEPPAPCKYFAKGSCRFGERCTFSHDLSRSRKGYGAFLRARGYLSEQEKAAGEAAAATRVLREGERRMATSCAGPVDPHSEAGDDQPRVVQLNAKARSDFFPWWLPRQIGHLALVLAERDVTELGIRVMEELREIADPAERPSRGTRNTLLLAMGVDPSQPHPSPANLPLPQPDPSAPLFDRLPAEDSALRRALVRRHDTNWTWIVLVAPLRWQADPVERVTWEIEDFFAGVAGLIEHEQVTLLAPLGHFYSWKAERASRAGLYHLASVHPVEWLESGDRKLFAFTFRRGSDADVARYWREDLDSVLGSDVDSRWP